MSAEHMRETVNKYVESVNTGNIDLTREIFAEDGKVEDPYGTPAKEGMAAIVEFYESFKDYGVKMSLTGPIRCAGNAAAFPFQVEMGDNILDIIDVFEFNEEGKVTSMKAYWGQ